MTSRAIPFPLQWQKALGDPGLAFTPSERLVGHVLATFMNVEGRCWPTIEQLCVASGYKASTVYRALGTLVHFGYLRRVRGRSGRATTYQATLPDYR